MPGRAVTLDVDLVAGLAALLAAEEVVEADFVQAGRRGVRRDVAADVGQRVRAADHDRGVPADVGADPPLDELVAREPRLGLGRDRVDVVGRAQRGNADLLLPGALEQLEHQESGPSRAGGVDHAVERVEPLLGFSRVDIGDLTR